MYKDTKLADYNSNTFYRRYNVTSNLTLNPFRTTEIKLGIQGYLANATIRHLRRQASSNRPISHLRPISRRSTPTASSAPSRAAI